MCVWMFNFLSLLPGGNGTIGHLLDLKVSLYFSVIDNKLEASDMYRLQFIGIASKVQETEVQQMPGAPWKIRTAENTHNSRHLTLRYPASSCLLVSHLKLIQIIFYQINDFLSGKIIRKLLIQGLCFGNLTTQNSGISQKVKWIFNYIETFKEHHVIILDKKHKGKSAKQIT